MRFLIDQDVDAVTPLLLARADITVRLSADGIRDSSDWA